MAKISSKESVGGAVPHLRLAVACGGTGGHILPGLQTAMALRADGHAVTLWLSGRKIESTVASGWDGPVQRVPAVGMPNGHALRTVVASARLGLAVLRCFSRMVRDGRPDALLAMGSYSSFGPVVAAWVLRVPVILHEANAVPGKAVSFLSRFASAIGVAFPGAGEMLRAPTIEHTGMPLRGGLEEVRTRRPGGVAADVLTVLVMGGSQGAQALNTVAAEAAHLLADSPVRFIHLTGPSDYERVCKLYGEAISRHELHSYHHDMAALYTRADLAVCRSGGSSCAELALCGLPALLVPHPTSVRQHQQRNAAFYEAVGAADVCAQKDLSAQWLRDYILSLDADRERLTRMGRATRAASVAHGAERLAALVARSATA